MTIKPTTAAVIAIAIATVTVNVTAAQHHVRLQPVDMRRLLPSHLLPSSSKACPATRPRTT